MSENNNEVSEITEEALEYHPRNLSAVPMDLASIMSEIETENEVLEYHPRNLSAVPMELAQIMNEIENSNK